MFFMFVSDLTTHNTLTLHRQKRFSFTPSLSCLFSHAKILTYPQSACGGYRKGTEIQWVLRVKHPYPVLKRETQRDKGEGGKPKG
jgi:hypothetical protein